MNSYTAVIVKRPEWYIGYVAEIPGVMSQGKTVAELKENLIDALPLMLESNRGDVEKLAGAEAAVETIQVKVAP